MNSVQKCMMPLSQNGLTGYQRIFSKSAEIRQPWSHTAHIHTVRLTVFLYPVFKGCLNKLAFQARNPGVICCPTCKIDTTLFPKTFESVRNLPKNFGVLEILEGKEEAQTDGIHKEKEKNKYLCPEHDEALKVYCYTDNCLICIYCQVCVAQLK